MVALRLVPAALSLLLLAAHFLRSGNLPAVGITLALLGVLAVRRPWAARVVQIALLLGAAEWVRTLVALADVRSRFGQPMLRMILILGAVAGLTALSALVFRAPRVRNWYARGGSPPVAAPPDGPPPPEE